MVRHVKPILGLSESETQPRHRNLVSHHPPDNIDISCTVQGKRFQSKKLQLIKFIDLSYDVMRRWFERKNFTWSTKIVRGSP